jgi:hypothetical protein
MITLFKQEKSIWSTDGAPVNIVLEDILLRTEAIVSVESAGDGRCRVGLSNARELIVKHTFDEVYGLLMLNTKNSVI